MLTRADQLGLKDNVKSSNECKGRGKGKGTGKGKGKGKKRKEPEPAEDEETPEGDRAKKGSGKGKGKRAAKNGKSSAKGSGDATKGRGKSRGRGRGRGCKAKRPTDDEPLPSAGDDDEPLLSAEASEPSVGLAMDVASSAAAASVSAKKRKVRKVRGKGLRKIRKSKKAAKAKAGKPSPLPEPVDEVPEAARAKRRVKKAKKARVQPEPVEDAGAAEEFQYPATFASRNPPKTEGGKGWHLWHAMAKAFLSKVDPLITDRSKSKRQAQEAVLSVHMHACTLTKTHFISYMHLFCVVLSTITCMIVRVDLWVFLRPERLLALREDGLHEGCCCGAREQL